MDTLPMFEELPVYQEDLDKIKTKKRPSNCLQEIVIELMNERGLKDADIIRATGIAWGTWMGWVNGDVGSQLADENLKKLMHFFNVHLEYLVYGIGDGRPMSDDFKNVNEGE